ncbi:MAG TPA: DUF1236 domain-containing protein [Xanthobacteraceae bacterium]|jgi:hypothetical protein|nr:DUF1236 domain-containing protein [Xanthobacteraceae bacterium]
MTIAYGTAPAGSLAAALLLLAPLALIATAAPATAQTPPSATPPSASLGAADPTAPLALTPAEKTAILNAVRQDSQKPNGKMPVNAPVSVGVQLPPSIALRILPDAALAQAPAAKTVQYTLIGNQVVLVDPTNMRVVEIINQ